MLTELETLQQEARETGVSARRAGTRIEVVPPEYGRELRAFVGPHAHRNAYRAGMWCRAVFYREPKALGWAIEHGMVGPGEAREIRAMTEGVNTSGGFLVPVEMSNAIIKVREDYGLARRECSRRTMASEQESVPRRATGVTAAFVGETTATTPSDVGYSQVALVAKEISALTRISKSLAEDGTIEVAEDVANEMGYAFAKKEDECLIDGDATSTYGGMVGFRAKMVDGNHAGALVTATGGDDQFTELLLADIISVIGKLPAHAHARAKWYCSAFCWGVGMLRLVGAAGGSTAQKEFMGYPVEISAAMPGAASAYDGAVMLAFGDLSRAATLGDRRGFTVEVDRSRYLEYRQLGIMGTERFDIVVHDIGDASAAGPLVALVGNT